MNEAPTIYVYFDLLLRKPKESDLDDRVDLGKSIEYAQMVGESIKNITSFNYNDSKKLFEKEMMNKYSWVIVYKGEMIGICRLVPQDSGVYRYSIDIYDDSLYSEGIGTKVTKAVVGYAFTTLKLDELELKVLEYNKRAIRCFEKCDFDIEETLKDSHEIDGRFYNEVIMKLYN